MENYPDVYCMLNPAILIDPDGTHIDPLKFRKVEKLYLLVDEF